MACVLTLSFLLSLLICLSISACEKSQAVKDVESAISAIGEVTLDSEGAILKAERMYEYLTDSEKTEVENKGILVEARYTYEQLYTDKIFDTAKEAYDLMTDASTIYMYNAYGLNRVGNFGENVNVWTMDSDFCKQFAEATQSVMGLPKLTEQEAHDALEYYYNEKGLSENMKADKFLYDAI